MNPENLNVIRAWVRLGAAIDAFNATLREEFGLSGLQLAMLRMLGEAEQTSLSELRARLVLHPATAGQAMDALVKRKLCLVHGAPHDGRAKLVTLTSKGRGVLEKAPLAGPVRLRRETLEPARARKLSAAFDDAIIAFGLQPWAPLQKVTMKPEPVEETINIGVELGKRLRASGIPSRERLLELGDEESFRRLTAKFPADACTHTRLALAGAVRGVRWMKLKKSLRESLTKSLR